MTREEILQYNKRCAKFIGYNFKYYTDDKSKKTSDITFVWGSEADIFKRCNNWWRCSLTPSDSCSWYFPKDLKFHSDWNWIHEVIEAVEKLDSEDNSVEFNRQLDNCLSLIIYSKKESVVEAINKFLIWYEQNN